MINEKNLDKVIYLGAFAFVEGRGLMTSSLVLLMITLN